MVITLQILLIFIVKLFVYIHRIESKLNKIHSVSQPHFNNNYDQQLGCDWDSNIGVDAERDLLTIFHLSL